MVSELIKPSTENGDLLIDEPFYVLAVRAALDLHQDDLFAVDAYQVKLALPPPVPEG